MPCALPIQRPACLNEAPASISRSCFGSAEPVRNCRRRGYFTSWGRGIGYSFQLAITAPLYSIIGYCIATAQSWQESCQSNNMCWQGLNDFLTIYLMYKQLAENNISRSSVTHPIRVKYHMWHHKPQKCFKKKPKKITAPSNNWETKWYFSFPIS